MNGAPGVLRVPDTGVAQLDRPRPQRHDPRDLIALRAQDEPEFDVLTFEHLTLDGRATPDEVRTYAQLYANANRIAVELIARGLDRGDRFALMMRNHPEFVETMFASSITGCIFVPIDPRTRGEKLSYTLRNAGCRGIICADYCLEQVQTIRDTVPEMKWILCCRLGRRRDRHTGRTYGTDPLSDVLTHQSAS